MKFSLLNMKSFNIIILLIVYFLSLTLVKAESFKPLQVLKVPKSRSSFDISHDYHITLLNMALVEAAKGRPVPKLEVMTSRMSQGRAMAELVKGEMLDIYWLGSDIATDKKLRAIRVPTTRGLIGFLFYFEYRPTVSGESPFQISAFLLSYFHRPS